MKNIWGRRIPYNVLGIIGCFLLFITCKDKEFNTINLQIDIVQDSQTIYLSTFAEPPQFAIWLEGVEDNEFLPVFVTHRSAKQDWEGKPRVPVAVPTWFDRSGEQSNADAYSGATPRDSTFTITTRIPEGSIWDCYIEVNLAGDFNEYFPEFNKKTLVEDEFFCGQPALIYKARVVAKDGYQITPELIGQSVVQDKKSVIHPVDNGVTTARNVFKRISIEATDFYQPSETLQ